MKLFLTCSNVTDRTLAVTYQWNECTLPINWFPGISIIVSEVPWTRKYLYATRNQACVGQNQSLCSILFTIHVHNLSYLTSQASFAIEYLGKSIIDTSVANIVAYKQALVEDRMIPAGVTSESGRKR